ncbi:MAG: TrmH family RNA methyltransferase [Bacteroidota bacterium]|nr:TrmH family RNA methyltransferase [Bacteroidota bacterium]
MPRHTIDSITDRRRARLEAVLRRRQTGLTIVIENVWDPHNVSAILRSADAVGIRTVHLLYTIEKAPNLKRHGKQSSASARKWLEFHVHDSVEDCFAALRAEDFRVYASHLTNHAIGLHDIDFAGRTAIVLGNEHRGVSEEACALADGVYYIPMMGMVESLNVSVAAAVSLYEALRQRNAAGLYDTPQLGEQGVRETLISWAKK